MNDGLGTRVNAQCMADDMSAVSQKVTSVGDKWDANRAHHASHLDAVRSYSKRTDTFIFVGTFGGTSKNVIVRT